MTRERTIVDLTEEQKLELEYQNNYIGKLKADIKAIQESYDKHIQKNTDAQDQISNYLKFIEAIQLNLQTQAKPYSPAELTEIIEKTTDAYKSIAELIPSGVYEQTSTSNRARELSNDLVSMGLSNGPVVQAKPELIGKALRNLEEFRSGETRNIRTIGLEMLNEVIMRNSKMDIIKSIISDDVLRKPGTSEDSLRAKAKILFKNHFSTSRNRPEIKVLKLISELKLGDTADIHKHNSELLTKIMNTCRIALPKSDFVENQLATRNKQEALIEAVVKSDTEVLNGRKNYEDNNRSDPLQKLASDILRAKRYEGDIDKISRNTNSSKSQKFLANIYLFASGVVNRNDANPISLSDLTKKFERDLQNTFLQKNDLAKDVRPSLPRNKR